MKLDGIRKELAKAAAEYKPIYKKWSKDEDDIIREFYGKVPMKLLSQKLDRTTTSIQQHASQLRGA